MKILKVLSTGALSAALIASMAVTASAADDDYAIIEDNETVVLDLDAGAATTSTTTTTTSKAASDKTVNDSKDLVEGKTLVDVMNAARRAGADKINTQSLRNFLVANEDLFTAADYADFVAACQEIQDLYTDPAAKELGYSNAAYVDDEKSHKIYNHISTGDREAIFLKLSQVAKAHGINVDLEANGDGFPVIYASTLTDANGNGAQLGNNGAIAATGADVTAESTTGAVAFAGVALLFAATGIVIVARKNRA